MTTEPKLPTDFSTWSHESLVQFSTEANLKMLDYRELIRYLRQLIATAPEKRMESFNEWYEDQCAIDAAETVGPNSSEYEWLVERFVEDETRRDAAMHRYTMEFGHRE